MHGAHEFLSALTIVLGVAAVTTLLFQRLHQPVVLGYILAGLIIGPHVPLPLIANRDVVATLSELGVIMLMFGLGLEFSIGKLFRAAPTAGVTAVIQCSVMMLLGFVTGRLLGWTTMESIFVGAVIAISSTTIIAKAFDEQKIQGKVRDLVVAILIVEDLIAVLLMALLTGVSSGSGLSATDLAITVAELAGFLVLLVVVGLFVVPRAMRMVVRVGRPETTIIASIAVCFGVSLLALEFGYSVALGAFVAGMLVAESGEARQIEPLVNPVRDVFAAVFFVSVGMMIDPMTLVDHWFAVVVLTIVVIVGKIVSVSIGAFLVGTGTRTSVAAGMSLAQIGEFSFIIAGLGLTLGAIGDFLYPVAVAVSAVTTLTTPWLIKLSGRAGQFVDRKLPGPMQTFVGFYEGWIERLRARRDAASIIRRVVRILMLDVVAVATVVIAVSLSFEDLIELLAVHLELDRSVGRIVIAVVGGAFALPFCVGILLSTRRLATVLADTVVPRSGSARDLDLGQAPRGVLTAALQLAGVLIAGLPLVALTTPFLPGFTAAAVLGAALVVLAILFWRMARHLHGHVRAASHVILEALAAQSSADSAHAADAHAATDPLLPGLTSWEQVELPPDARAVGRSLASLELRGTTGATVLAIRRDGHGIVAPDKNDPLRAGDVLAIAGSRDAIEGAIAILRGT
ncbi:MAG: potassium/proton antiporter rosb [Myxococcales bacterium]|nr:potassium/proton antiporter rosb [Myxococcales bacterium]